MAHSRTIQISVVMLTLMALVAWGGHVPSSGVRVRHRVAVV